MTQKLTSLAYALRKYVAQEYDMKKPSGIDSPSAIIFTTRMKTRKKDLIDILDLTERGLREALNEAGWLRDRLTLIEKQNQAEAAANKTNAWKEWAAIIALVSLLVYTAVMATLAAL